MEWVCSDNCLIENGSHKLTGSDSIYTEHIKSEKFPSKVTNVTIEGQLSGYVQKRVS